MPLSIDELDFGPPHYMEHLPPVSKRNYGKWKYHEHVKPGVIKHVAESGEELYTVRVAVPKFIAAETLKKFCDIADKYCEGHLKITYRFNVCFPVPKAEDVDRVIEEVEALGFPVGGTGRSLKTLFHCSAFAHCHTAATDSPSIAKAIYEEFYDDFKNPNAYPERVKIAIAGCVSMCGPTHASDISIIGVHRRPPRVIDEVVEKACSVPELVKTCPTYAIKPKRGNPRSVEVDPEKCVYCGNCFGICEGMPIADPENDGVSIWVGGKASNTRRGPMFARLVVPFIPNDPPKWTEVVKTVRKIIDAYRANAEEGERLGEWIERIGWEKFFKLADIPFAEQLIDDYIFSIETFRRGTNFKMV
jgi:sulfite reductase beta subunit